MYIYRVWQKFANQCSDCVFSTEIDSHLMHLQLIVLVDNSSISLNKVSRSCHSDEGIG